MPTGITSWINNLGVDLVGKNFDLFGFTRDGGITEYDLLYFYQELLYMGAKPIDGSPTTDIYAPLSL